MFYHKKLTKDEREFIRLDIEGDLTKIIQDYEDKWGLQVESMKINRTPGMRLGTQNIHSIEVKFKDD